MRTIIASLLSIVFLACGGSVDPDPIPPPADDACAADAGPACTSAAAGEPCATSADCCSGVCSLGATFAIPGSGLPGSCDAVYVVEHVEAGASDTRWQPGDPGHLGAK